MPWPTPFPEEWRPSRTSSNGHHVRSFNNIAEGAGEFSQRDKARFYRMALRSATESAAILDTCRVLGVAAPDSVDRGRELLLRIVEMLTRMIVRLGERGRGSAGDVAGGE